MSAKRRSRRQGAKKRRDEALPKALEQWLKENNLLSLRALFSGQGLDLHGLATMPDPELTRFVQRIEGRDHLKKKLLLCVAELRKKQVQAAPLHDPALQALDRDLEIALFQLEGAEQRIDEFVAALQSAHEGMLAQKNELFEGLLATIPVVERRVARSAKRVLQAAADEVQAMEREGEDLVKKLEQQREEVAKVEGDESLTFRERQDRAQLLTDQAQLALKGFNDKFRECRTMELCDPSRVVRALRTRVGDVVHVPLEAPSVVLYACSHEMFTILVDCDKADPNEVRKVEVRLAMDDDDDEEKDGRPKEQSVELLVNGQQDVQPSRSEEEEANTWAFAQRHTKQVGGRGPWALGFRGLQRAFAYRIRVRAFNEFGPSPPVSLSVRTARRKPFEFSARLKSRGVQLLSKEDLLRLQADELAAQLQRGEEQDGDEKVDRVALQRAVDEMAARHKVAFSYAKRFGPTTLNSARVRMVSTERWSTVCVETIIETTAEAKRKQNAEAGPQPQGGGDGASPDNVVAWVYTLRSKLAGRVIFGVLRARGGRPMLGDWRESIYSSNKHIGAGFMLAFPDNVKACSQVDGAKVQVLQDEPVRLPKTEHWTPGDKVELRLFTTEGILEVFRNGQKIGTRIANLGSGSWLPFASCDGKVEVSVDLVQMEG